MWVICRSQCMFLHYVAHCSDIVQCTLWCSSAYIRAEVSHLILEQVKHPGRALHNYSAVSDTELHNYSAVKDTGLHNSAVRDTELHNYSTMRDTGLHNSLLYAAQCSAVREAELHNSLAAITTWLNSYTSTSNPPAFSIATQMTLALTSSNRLASISWLPIHHINVA